jgi:hypothetical protein
VRHTPTAVLVLTNAALCEEETAQNPVTTHRCSTSNVQVLVALVANVGKGVISKNKDDGGGKLFSK